MVSVISDRAGGWVSRCITFSLVAVRHSIPNCIASKFDVSRRCGVRERHEHEQSRANKTAIVTLREQRKKCQMRSHNPIEWEPKNNHTNYCCFKIVIVLKSCNWYLFYNVHVCTAATAAASTRTLDTPAGNMKTTPTQINGNGNGTGNSNSEGIYRAKEKIPKITIKYMLDSKIVNIHKINKSAEICIKIVMWVHSLYFRYTFHRVFVRFVLFVFAVVIVVVLVGSFLFVALLLSFFVYFFLFLLLPCRWL